MKVKPQTVERRINVLAGRDKSVNLDKHIIRITHEDGKREEVTARKFITDPKYSIYGSKIDRVELLKSGQTTFVIGPKFMDPVVKVTHEKMMHRDYQKSVSVLRRSIVGRQVADFSQRAKRGDLHPEEALKDDSIKLK